MKLSRVQLAKILAERLPKARSQKKLADEIAAYLLAEGRTRELDSLLRDMQQVEADNGRLEAIAMSAFPLSPKSRNEVRATLKKAFPTAKQITVTEQLDPEVIGGVRLELANQQLDVSVRSKLNRFIQLTTAKN